MLTRPAGSCEIPRSEGFRGRLVLDPKPAHLPFFERSPLPGEIASWSRTGPTSRCRYPSAIIATANSTSSPRQLHQPFGHAPYRFQIARLSNSLCNT